MPPERKRAIVSHAYPGDNWLVKLEKMSDAQVHNVYMRLLNQNKLKGIATNVQHRKS